MGKGVIKGGGPEGEYQVEIVMNRAWLDEQISKLEANITAFNAKLLVTEGFLARKVIELQIKSCEKKIELFDSTCPEDQTVSAWCADLTEDLTGIVSTVEVPGESTNIQIRPGYDGGSSYEKDRDGQLTQTMAQPATGAYYNLAMLPGWQKWKPTYRYATIDSIDGDSAGITLFDDRSSQQNLSINQTETISDVEIKYMTCNGSAFSEGDKVLVVFEDQDWGSPKIIGFKDHPQSCGEIVFVQSDYFCFLWDTETDDYYQGAWDNSGEPVTSFPVETASLMDWLSGKSSAGTTLYGTSPCQNRTPAKEECTVPGTTGVWTCTKSNDEPNGCPDENGTLVGDNTVIFSLTQTNNPPNLFIYDAETNYEFPVSNLSLVAEPNNIEKPPRSFTVKVDWINTYYRKNNGASRFEDKTISTSTSTFKNPFGSVSALSTENFDEVRNHYPTYSDYHGGSQREENVFGSGNVGIAGSYSKKTIAQLWYFSGAKVKKENRQCAQDFEAGGWYNNTGFIGFGPAPSCCDWSTSYYESAGPEIWGGVETHEDTSVVDPFGAPSGGGFVDAAEELRRAAEKEAGGPWDNKVFRPGFGITIIR